MQYVTHLINIYYHHHPLSSINLTVCLSVGTANGRSVIRAESPHTLWRFQAVEPIASAQEPGPDGSGTARDRAKSPLTRVEVQVLLRDSVSFLTLPYITVTHL